MTDTTYDLTPPYLSSWDVVRDMPRPLVVVTGAFNGIMPHHVRLLEYTYRIARGQDGTSVVAINGDESLAEHRRKRGDRNYVVIPAEERAYSLMSIQWVDTVTAFERDGDGILLTDPGLLLEYLSPVTWVKGGDYDRSRLLPIEIEAVEERGGRIIFAPRYPGVSTSQFIQDLRGSTAIRGSGD